jgi:hypothetical protein
MVRPCPQLKTPRDTRFFLDHIQVAWEKGSGSSGLVSMELFGVLVAAVAFLAIIYLSYITHKDNIARYTEVCNSRDVLTERNSELQVRMAELSAENAALRTKHVHMNRAVVELPLPDDLGESSGATSVFLPKFRHRGDGAVEVMLPSDHWNSYELNVEPSFQTNDERERIWSALRKNVDARAELAIGLLWRDDSAHAAEFSIGTKMPRPR